MYIKQNNLLAGMNKGFVKRLISQTEKKSFAKGHVIFREGHHANRFYVLQTGCVKLMFGTGSQLVFTVNHAGEAFGWSSLLGRTHYAATAVCVEPTRLVRIDRLKFNAVLDEDPVNGLILIRRLGELLGERLNMSYKMIAARGMSEEAYAYGSGQTVGVHAPA